MAGWLPLVAVAALAAAAGEAAAPAVPAVPVTDAAMREATDRLLAEVGAVRRIRPAGGLERHLVTRAEARAQVESAVTGALGGVELATVELILQRLGLFPRGSDYVRLLADAYGAAPAGGY